jgi:hypothetical protein
MGDGDGRPRTQYRMVMALCIGETRETVQVETLIVGSSPQEEISANSEFGPRDNSLVRAVRLNCPSVLTAQCEEPVTNPATRPSLHLIRPYRSSCASAIAHALMDGTTSSGGH